MSPQLGALQVIATGEGMATNHPGHSSRIEPDPLAVRILWLSRRHA